MGSEVDLAVGHEGSVNNGFVGGNIGVVCEGSQTPNGSSHTDSKRKNRR